MALLKFISLSVGSLMLLQGAYAGVDSATGQTKECLDDLNKARKEVGLPDFKKVEDTSKQYLTSSSLNTEFLKAICVDLRQDKPIVIPKKEGTFDGATAAYARKIEECSAAVDEWKKGFSAFKNDNNALPGAFAKASEGTTGDPKLIYGKAPYNTSSAVNFVALYSGKTNATAECSLVTCTSSTDGEEKALVCMTYPAALVDNEAPYDQTQWDNILKVFAPTASSASAAVPTVLALAAAAVGVALI